MTYDVEKWKKRIRSRTDLSSYVCHVTRENGTLSAYEVLIKILNEQILLGSSNTSFIAGTEKAVCFQDVPIYSLCQNVLHEQDYRHELGGKIRYRPIGIAFPKRYVYMKGGRPVIYEKLDVAKKILNQEEWWRIVSFDLSNKEQIVDWTHEREWRVKGDFKFNLKFAYILLTHHGAYKYIITKLSSSILNEVGGVIVLDPILT
jgi:hypothetical protein